MRGVVLVVALVGAACGSDAGGGPSDGGVGGTVVGSAECNAYCANIVNACGPGTRCNEDFFCRIREGECAASTRAKLACTAMMTPVCLEGGWGIGACSADNSVCGD
jgi:hypothetical protein